MPIRSLFRPYRARSLFLRHTQGVALGCFISASQAEEQKTGYAQRIARLPLGSLGLALVLAAAAPLYAQRDAQVPDPDPELERQALQVADGFEVNLFAADPLLAKPIQMNFDAAGRLWVACSSVYPQIKPGQVANDKIIILEDTRGVGRADKTTVFADGLLIPTGLEPGDGGVYVADSTDLLHLSDASGTGRADRRRVVLSGFGTEDTHHLLHTLRWGPDGMLYMNQSIYIHSHIETPHGPRRLSGGGIWQFRPETLKLEVFARGWINPWGHHFDRWGQSFVADGAGFEGISYVVPGASYATAVGATRLLRGMNPGSPKYCGAEFTSGRHLPDDWQDNLLTNDFRGHRVCRFILKEDGAGYAAQEKPELIKTSHPAFRPVDVKMGPDGAIYIADWYNPIIQHGEVDFRDPRRDVTHGRIWRVTARGRPLVDRPKLADAPTAALLEALKAPEDWTRHHARRVLKERGADKVVPALAAWVGGLDPNDQDHEHHLVEALWTYQSLDVVEPRLLARVAQAQDHHARTAAMRVVQHWHARLPDTLELLAAGVADPHPQVRLEAVRSLARIAQPRAVELALRALDRPVDANLDYALWLTARELEPVWLPALESGQLDFGDNVRHLVFALQAAGTREALRPLLSLVKNGKVPADREEPVLTLIGTLGGPPELTLLLDRVVSREVLPPGHQAVLLAALEQAARQRQTRPAGDLGRIAPLLDAGSDEVRAGAARLAGLWRLEALRPRLLDMARAPQTTPVVRQAAFEGLELIGGKASRDAFTQLAGAERPAAVRRLAVVALAGLDLKEAARLAVMVLAAEQTATDAAPLFAAFVNRKNGAAELAAALDGHPLPADVARIGIRGVRQSGRDAPALVAALARAGSLTFGPRTLTDPEMRQMMVDVARLGDPARGEALYRRQDLSCQKCHALAGAGGQVGPDLASIGTSAPVDYLIDSLLVPNKAIKEGYHALTVTTRQGRIFTGIKVSETKDQLLLRTAEDRELAILNSDIEEQASGGSLMPDGLTDTLTRGEFLDLVRFLSELGKVGPYSVSKARLVRRWEALAATPAAVALLRRFGRAAAVGDDPALAWAPVYSLVSGTLPLDAAPRLELRTQFDKEASPAAVVRCRLEVTTGGKVKLRLNSSAGVTLWLDRAAVAVEAHDEMVLDLVAGTHTLTFALDLAQRREGLRCELDDEAGSPARVRIVGGELGTGYGLLVAVRSSSKVD